MNNVQKHAVVLFALSIQICALLVSVSFAVPAAPELHTLMQPDGTTFKARQWGDENLHGWETDDGYTILQDSASGYWVYAERGVRGELVPSLHLTGLDIQPQSLLKHIRPTGEALSGLPMRRLSRELKPLTVSSTGTANIPIILVNFKGETTTYNTADFESLLFGTGTKSMSDYYYEVSYGKFDVSSGPGGVKGWYTAANGHDYYGANNADGDDVKPATLVREAVAAADATMNFAPYDMDGDCYVDVVMVAHQGTDEAASGIPTDIWSHRWNLKSAAQGGDGAGEYITNDVCPKGGFIKINDYTIQPEKISSGGYISTIGVFAHEYGHALGLPDLYDTDYTSTGIGRWSLMAFGADNYTILKGDTPAHLDAWSKYALGWVTPTQVFGTLSNEPVAAASVNADIYQLLPGSPLTGIGEYFLVENRQKISGSFDEGLPASGLLIWHIDDGLIAKKRAVNKKINDYECYPGGPSCVTDHYGVKLVQADNLWQLEKNLSAGDAGDPFPGTYFKTTFNDLSLPTSNLYNGSASGVSVTNISASGATMHATFNVPIPLNEAVDNLNLKIYGFGTQSWIGQNSEYYYGGDAAQSGPITHNENSWMETKITGPATVSFKWRVSSEYANDTLKFFIDDIEQSRISGETTWATKTYSLGSGIHTLRWRYGKDSSITSGLDAGWVDRIIVTYTDTVAPTIGNVTPSPIVTPYGLEQLFTVVYSDAGGYERLKTMEMLVNTTTSSLNAMRVKYDQTTNKIALFFNDGSTSGACVPGTPGMIKNTQGSLNCQNTKVWKNGNDITVVWALTANAAYASATAKKMLVQAADMTGNIRPWIQKGSWTILANNVAPIVGSVTPSSLTSVDGAPETLTGVYSDANGNANLMFAGIQVGNTTDGSNSIKARYIVATNTLKLFDNSGSTALSASCTPGQALKISNSQGTLNCNFTSVTRSGKYLIVNWNLTPKAVFTGTKDVRLMATDNSLVNAIGIKGSWTILADPPLSGPLRTLTPED